MSEEKDFTLHMVGHGHIDPTWLWRWTEGYEEVRATFRSALDRMNETPGVHFTASSACFYQWVRECDPELFEAIRARVCEGRWEIVGGMWVEPDCNIPCGESFVRHGLYSQRFFQKEFGKRATVGFNPDSFGHAGSLPQILKKLGMDFYAYMRPWPMGEMNYADGTTFWWESPDGARVLAVNIIENYSAVGDELHRRVRYITRNPYLNPGQKQILSFFGVGNHGGGPTKQAIQALLADRNDPEVPGIEFSTLRGYFDAFLQDTKAENIPVIATDLQHHARGCYSVCSEVKRLNRQVEHALMSAERFATAAWMLEALPYPEDQFDAAWKDLLYNQFHDILAGSSPQSSYTDTRDQLGAARHRADVIRNMSIQAIARTIDTTAEGNTVVVINPLTWPVKAAVLVPPIADRTLDKPLHLVDDTETPVPSQVVRGERIDHNRHAFIAQVPAMGYRLYHLRSHAKPLRSTAMLEASPQRLENTWWRIDFDPCTGAFCGLHDKTRKTDVLRRGNVLAALVDQTDTWSHGLEEWRVEAGRFGQPQIDVVENGDVLATVRVRSRYAKSEAILETTLYRDTDTIDCFLRVNWQEQYQVLKLVWETNITAPTATYESAYGHTERAANGGEEPGQQWFDLSGGAGRKPCGLAVLNDSKYSFDVRDGVMRMTVLRSPAYAHHDNGRFSAEDGWPIMDQGWQELRFQLVPHGGDWRDARVVKQGWELNAPPVVHCESAHPGTRAAQASLLGTESDNVLLSVIKRSEEGGDIIIRGYETAGRPARTRLHLPHLDKSYDLAFTPHEIKTVRIDSGDWTLREVNLLEE